MPKPATVVDVPRLAWSPREIAASTGLSYHLVLKEIRAKRMKAFKVGHQLRVSDQELHRWLSQP